MRGRAGKDVWPSDLRNPVRRRQAGGGQQKKGWFSKLKDDVSDFGSAVKTSVSNVVSAAKESYQNHGTMYDVVEYGKAALKIGKGVVKIAGAVAACSTVAGIPVALCIITSAGNDIASASADIVHVARDEYDEVGKTNYLKDLLKKNGGELGEMLGNKKAGEKFGELAYTGLDMVSLLKGTEKMLKSFGKLNTDLTGKTGYSFCGAKPRLKTSSGMSSNGTSRMNGSGVSSWTLIRRRIS